MAGTAPPKEWACSDTEQAQQAYQSCLCRLYVTRGRRMGIPARSVDSVVMMLVTFLVFVLVVAVIVMMVVVIV